MRSFSFPKKERLLDRKAFVNLNRTGKRRHAAHFLMIHSVNGLGITRLGITVNRKTGNSVQRNRTKRLVREFYRLNKGSFPQGLDLVIIAKIGAADLDFQTVCEELFTFTPG